jgi:hypothetical protein
MRPEVVFEGTLMERVVAVAETVGVKLVFTTTRSFGAVASKLTPVIVIGIPTVPIVGAKVVMTGWPLSAVTVNIPKEVAVPEGDVTLIAPLVDVDGTVTVRSVSVAELTVAIVPLKRTVFELGMGLNPVPLIATVVPIGPCVGINPLIEICDDEFRAIDSRLPTASYA